MTDLDDFANGFKKLTHDEVKALSTDIKFVFSMWKRGKFYYFSDDFNFLIELTKPAPDKPLARIEVLGGLRNRLTEGIMIYQREGK